MKNIAAILVTLALALTTFAKPKEVIIQFETLPFAVQKTIKGKAGTAKVVRVVRESENGKDSYDAIVNRGGKEVAISVDDTGHYLGEHDEASAGGAKAKGQ